MRHDPKKKHALFVEEEQMSAARTKQHEEEKTYGTGIKADKNKKIRKQGKKQEKRTQRRRYINKYFEVVTKLPVSATKPSRGCEERGSR